MAVVEVFDVCFTRLYNSLHRSLRYVTCSHVQYVFQAFGFKWLRFKPQLAVHLCSRKDN